MHEYFLLCSDLPWYHDRFNTNYLFILNVGIFQRNFCVIENRESFRISCGRGGTRVDHSLQFLETPYVQRYNLAT
jgi:hypothetical protein